MATEPTEDQNVPPPKLLAPADGTVFDIFPRTTLLSWEAVAGAISYGVEVGIESGSTFYSAVQPEGRFEFFGAQAGRWRVWAVLPDNRRSPASEWRGFQYLR